MNEYADTEVDETQSLLNSASVRRNDDQSLSLFDPRHKFYRYFSLIFICMLLFGTYFCYVLPGALEHQFEHDLKITTSQFTIFNSLYSWPNIFLCFFGGFLIDRVLGNRLGAIVFSSFVTLGQFIVSYGAYTKNVTIMYVGTFVFGIGGETLGVAQKTYAVKWFPHNEVNLVFGFIASVSLLGSSLNQAVMGPIYDYVGEFVSGHKCLSLTIFVGTLIALFSTVCSLILVPLDRRRTRVLRVASRDRVEDLEAAEKIKFKDILKFPVELWLLIIVAMVFYSVTFPFISLAKLYFVRKYEWSPTIASIQQSLFFLGTVVTSPLFGKIVDRVGYNLYWINLSVLAALAAHLIFIFSFLNSFIPVMMLGMALSLVYASLWPMVSVIVSNHQLATAYGLMQSFQNLGLAITNILIGYLLQHYGYFVLEIFFMFLSIVGLVASLALLFIDKIKDGPLNLSRINRNKLNIN